MRATILRTILAILIGATMTDVGLAQRTTATVAGIVQDSTGAVLPGAEVQLINEGTAEVLNRLTDETGQFRFDFVPAGTHTLRIALGGFGTYESRGISLGAAQNLSRTFTLQVGAVTDSVTVTGEAPLVNTLSPEQRSSLDALQVQTLPMTNRNIASILENSGPGLTRSSVNSVQGFGGDRMRMNGLGGGAMSGTADGGSASGVATSNIIGSYGGFAKIALMGAEAIGEVQVVKGVLPAEYSGLAGNLNASTKSGTNTGRQFVPPL